MQIASGWVGVALSLSAAGGLAFGGSWTKVDAGLPRSPVRVRTVVIDPSSPSTIYALEFLLRRAGATGACSRARMAVERGIWPADCPP